MSRVRPTYKDPVSVCRCSEYQDSHKMRRVGVIMYTVYNDRVYFGLGLDAGSHDLSDFGGSKKTAGESSLKGALREFTEETLKIFDPIDVRELDDCLVVHSERDLIVFARLDVDPQEVCDAYLTKYAEIMKHKGDIRFSMVWGEPEMCAIVWLTWGELQHSIRCPGIMYERIRLFLEAAGDFSKYL